MGFRAFQGGFGLRPRGSEFKSFKVSVAIERVALEVQSSGK